MHFFLINPAFLKPILSKLKSLRCTEGDIGVCGVAVLLSFLCGIPVNKIPHCGFALISNPTVCDVCAFKPTVFGETKLFAVLRHQQYQYSLHADQALWTVYMTL